MSNESSVYKCLDASTAHVPPDEREKLIGVFCANEYEEGWWLWVHPANDLPEESDGYPAVLALLAVARDLGCRWVNLDRDGDVLDGLPTYEEELCAVEDCESYPTYGNKFCAVHLPMMCDCGHAAHVGPCEHKDDECELCICAKPKTCIKCSQPIPEPVLDALEPERCVSCADPE